MAGSYRQLGTFTRSWPQNTQRASLFLSLSHPWRLPIRDMYESPTHQLNQFVDGFNNPVLQHADLPPHRLLSFEIVRAVRSLDPHPHILRRPALSTEKPLVDKIDFKLQVLCYALPSRINRPAQPLILRFVLQYRSLTHSPNLIELPVI